VNFVNTFFEELEDKGKEALSKLTKYAENGSPSLLRDIYRFFHTMKGSAGLVGFSGFQELMHELEDRLKYAVQGSLKLNDSEIARMVKALTELMNRTSDLSKQEVEKYRKLLRGEEEAEASITASSDDDRSDLIEYYLSIALKVENYLVQGDARAALYEVKRCVKELKHELEASKYVSLKKVLEGFDSMVFQEAALQGKKARLVVNVQDAKVPRKDSHLIRDILIHLVKNAVAHGIESPEERLKIGKEEEGKIRVRAWHEGGKIYLEISDDGRGIDLEKVREKAKSMGRGDLAPLDAVFLTGLSTKDATDLSAGRGIGLDAVKSFVKKRTEISRLKQRKEKERLSSFGLPSRGLSRGFWFAVTVTTNSHLTYRTSLKRWRTPRL